MSNAHSAGGFGVTGYFGRRVTHHRRRRPNWRIFKGPGELARPPPRPLALDTPAPTLLPSFGIWSNATRGLPTKVMQL